MCTVAPPPFTGGRPRKLRQPSPPRRLTGQAEKAANQPSPTALKTKHVPDTFVGAAGSARRPPATFGSRCWFPAKIIIGQNNLFDIGHFDVLPGQLRLGGLAVDRTPGSWLNSAWQGEPPWPPQFRTARTSSARGVSVHDFPKRNASSVVDSNRCKCVFVAASVHTSRFLRSAPPRFNTLQHTKEGAALDRFTPPRCRVNRVLSQINIGTVRTTGRRIEKGIQNCVGQVIKLMDSIFALHTYFQVLSNVIQQRLGQVAEEKGTKPLLRRTGLGEKGPDGANVVRIHAACQSGVPSKRMLRMSVRYLSKRRVVTRL